MLEQGQLAEMRFFNDDVRRNVAGETAAQKRGERFAPRELKREQG